MAEKKVRTRVQSKHDVEKNWASATFVPLPGEIIIYDKDKGVNGGTHEKPRIKVGDGTTAVGSLPFVVDKEATDAAIAAAKATVVSAFEQQNFTDEQKEIARNNIGAVDASLVVSEIHSNDAIPNGAALTNFATNNCVMAAIEQNLPDVDKRRARANIGAISQTELNEAIANAGGGTSSGGGNGAAGNFISYTETQALTVEQKQTARENINAVDANLVVSSLSRDEQIPNGAALKEFIDVCTMHECVRTDVQQHLFEDEQGLARSNIGAISQAELNEAIANAGGFVGSGGFVSYSVTQELTDEQQEIARNNINAVDASLVTDNVDNWNKIPNGNGLVNFFVSKQNFSPEQKEVARNNIDAVDANLVVSSFLDPSSHPRDVKIPNGAALFEYVAEYTNTSCVRNDVQQKIPAYNQELARSNIGAVSQAEFGSAVIDMVSRNELIGAIAATEATVVSAFEQQNFTDEQKEIARNNIDATGIYIGSGEMPEGYDIQIDTDGDVYSITNRITDDTNTEIPNCEAVKDYIANNITIADDGNGNITLNSSSNKVEFTDDGNGNIKMEVM